MKKQSCISKVNEDELDDESIDTNYAEGGLLTSSLDDGSEEDRK
jgi:hypothetical protein